MKAYNTSRFYIWCACSSTEDQSRGRDNPEESPVVAVSIEGIYQDSTSQQVTLQVVFHSSNRSNMYAQFNFYCDP